MQDGNVEAGDTPPHLWGLKINDPDYSRCPMQHIVPHLPLPGLTPFLPSPQTLVNSASQKLFSIKGPTCLQLPQSSVLGSV